MITYLIGCVIVFIFCKLCRTAAEANTEKDKNITCWLTLLSWIGVVFMLTVLIMTIFNKIQNKNNLNNKNNE